MKRLDQESSKQSRTLSEKNEKQPVIEKKTVTHRPTIQSNDISSSLNDISVTSQNDDEEEDETELITKNSNVISKKYSPPNKFFVPFSIIM